MKAYFSRQVPFYLLSAEDLTDELAFDAYPVEVDEVALANVRSVRRLVTSMEKLFENNPAPEECAQAEADALIEDVRRIFKTKAQDNTKSNFAFGSQDEYNGQE
jgi:hypothetical protein